MRTSQAPALALLLTLPLLVLSGSLPGLAGTAPPLARAAPLPGRPASAAPTPAQPSVLFVENAGQFADGARFRAYGGGPTLWLAEDALWVTVQERAPRAGLSIAADCYQDGDPVGWGLNPAGPPGRLAIEDGEGGLKTGLPSGLSPRSLALRARKEITFSTVSRTTLRPARASRS